MHGNIWITFSITTYTYVPKDCEYICDDFNLLVSENVAIIKFKKLL